MSNAGRGNLDEQLHEAAKEQLAAAAQRARERNQAKPKRQPSRRDRDDAYAKRIQRRENDKLEMERILALPPGPNLHSWLLRSPQSYAVTAIDFANLPRLEPCARTGRARGLKMFEDHRDEVLQRAAKIDVKPKALRILYLVAWAGHYDRGLQGPMRDLAELAGVSRSYCYDLVKLLEELGLVKRRRRDRRYANLTRDVPALHFVDVDGKPRPLKRWRDGDGKLHTFVDVQTVLYVTRKGLRSILSLERGRRGRPLQHGLWTTLWTELRDQGRRISTRKNTALAPRLHRTPSSGKSYVDTILLARGGSMRGLPVHNSAGPGPPDG